MTYALYFELVSGDAVRQNIFSPAFRVGTASVWPSYWSRTITPERPKRTWSRSVRSDYDPFPPSPFGSLDTAIREELKQLEGLSSHMREALVDTSSDLRIAFPFLLSESAVAEILEIQELKSNRVPTSILTEIRIQRKALELPALPGEDAK
jgi:hypothetical protein